MRDTHTFIVLSFCVVFYFWGGSDESTLSNRLSRSNHCRTGKKHDAPTRRPRRWRCFCDVIVFGFSVWMCSMFWVWNVFLMETNVWVGQVSQPELPNCFQCFYVDFCVVWMFSSLLPLRSFKKSSAAGRSAHQLRFFFQKWEKKIKSKSIYEHWINTSLAAPNIEMNADLKGGRALPCEGKWQSKSLRNCNDIPCSSRRNIRPSIRNQFHWLFHLTYKTPNTRWQRNANFVLLFSLFLFANETFDTADLNNRVDRRK